MDFIICDKDRKDIGYISDSAYLDIDIGDTYDFVYKERLDDYSPERCKTGNILYCIGTEYGGILEDPESDTETGYISFQGDTFRGMLGKKIIFPPQGKAYREISGELNACLRNIIGNQFGTIFVVSEKNTGVTVSNYRFDRYCSLLEGISKMLESKGHRLQIECVQNEDEISVELSAVPVNDYSEELETSQDSGINFTIKHYTNRYNYMVCLGQGELEKRTVFILHLKDDGTIEIVDSIPDGIDIRVYKYDYSSVESNDELIKAGKEQFSEINSMDTQKMSVRDGMELEIGDIVGGRDYVTGMTVKQPVTQKILKYQDGALTVSYKIGDGD